MRGVQLTELRAAEPAGAAAALDLVAGLDEALGDGLARLGAERLAALTELAGAFAATPLGPALAEAVEKIAAGSVTDEHLATLAGARTALFGAVTGARLAALDPALGRARAEWSRPVADEPPAAGPLAGRRSWLRELAIAGWRGVGHDLVSAVDQTVEALLADPAHRRLAVLVDGLAAELRAASPVAALDVLPARRWADLWSRALLLAQGGGQATDPEPVSGRLLILGADAHEHGTAFQVQVHAVLEPAGGAPPRLVRAAVGAGKVDTITGPAVWRLLQHHQKLLTALAERRALEITELPLLPGGDLVWDEERATVGEPADPFATARVLLPQATAAPVPPLDRHPVLIAEPVLVEGYDSDGATLELDGVALEIAPHRLPACGPLTPQLVRSSTACVGLLRLEGDRWLLQPLALQATVKRKPAEAHNGDWALGVTDQKIAKAEARAGDPVTVLRERAGRLLRK
ncbi:serine/threonine-protein kinase [Streptomyces mayteni]